MKIDEVKIGMIVATAKNPKSPIGPVGETLKGGMVKIIAYAFSAGDYISIRKHVRGLVEFKE